MQQKNVKTTAVGRKYREVQLLLKTIRCIQGLSSHTVMHTSGAAPTAVEVPKQNAADLYTTKLIGRRMLRQICTSHGRGRKWASAKLRTFAGDRKGAGIGVEFKSRLHKGMRLEVSPMSTALYRTLQIRN